MQSRETEQREAIWKILMEEEIFAALPTGWREEELVSPTSLRRDQVRLPPTSCCSLSLEGFHDPLFS